LHCGRVAGRGREDAPVSERIVSLLPSTTEILFAIGAGDRVVGVTHECDFPPAARALPVLTSSLLSGATDAAEIDRHVRAKVHAGSSLDALAPDLIVTQELCAVCAVSYDRVERAAKRLRSDPRVVSLEPSSLEDVYANIALLGDIAGAHAGAAALIASLRLRENALRERERPSPRPRTLVLEWTDPPMSGGHWTPGLVELAGGEAILAHPGANSQTLAWDAITAADPDVAIVVPCGFDLQRAHAAARELATNPAWSGLRAVRTGRAYVMDGNAFVNRPGPRLVESAELFAAALAGAPDLPDGIKPLPRTGSHP
jgi:iron complex transport system substrate-binding protein